MSDVTIYFSPLEGKDSWRVECSCLDWEARSDTLDEAKRMARLHQKRPKHDQGEPLVVDQDPFDAIEAQIREWEARGEKPKPTDPDRHEMMVETAEVDTAPALEGGSYQRARAWSSVCSCGWPGTTARVEDPDDASALLEVEWLRHAEGFEDWEPVAKVVRLSGNFRYLAERGYITRAEAIDHVIELANNDKLTLRQARKQIAKEIDDR